MFLQLVTACYMERIDLSAHGFYATPDIGFNWETGKGDPFRYFTYGAAFAEVEIDTLTGDFHTRQADVSLDLGFSINPAIDVGQVYLISHYISCLESEQNLVICLTVYPSNSILLISVNFLVFIYVEKKIHGIKQVCTIINIQEITLEKNSTC